MNSKLEKVINDAIHIVELAYKWLTSEEVVKLAKDLADKEAKDLKEKTNKLQKSKVEIRPLGEGKEIEKR